MNIELKNIKYYESFSEETLAFNRYHAVPPFTLKTAKQKIQMAEDGWNTKNPESCQWLIPLTAKPKPVY